MEMYNQLARLNGYFCIWIEWRRGQAKRENFTNKILNLPIKNDLIGKLFDKTLV